MKGHRQIFTDLLLTIFVLLSTAAIAFPQDADKNTGQERDAGFSVSASYLHQFDTDIEDSRGHKISEDSYDASPFLAATISFEF